MSYISLRTKNRFDVNNFSLSLALKQRLEATCKLPIHFEGYGKQFILLKNDSSCSQIMLYICLNRLNPETGKLGMSHSVFKKSDIRPLGKLILSVFSLLRLVQVEDGVGEDKKSTRVNNFTLINFVIKMLGPLHERTLTTIMLGIQVGFLPLTSKLLKLMIYNLLTF